MLDSSENPNQLLSGFKDSLSYDTESIILEKSFVFELVSGTNYPSLCSLSIPEAKYTGIKLEPDSEGGISGPFSDGFSTTIVGQFLYHDSVHAFKLGFSMDAPIHLKHDRGAINVSRTATAHFQIVLDVNTWLVGINLKSCIDNNSLPRQPNGDLVLVPPLAAGPCMGVLDDIRINMISNVVLKIF